jgi:hypothetical protein
MPENEKRLAQAVRAVAESLSDCLRIQAATNRILATRFPELAEDLTAAASGLDESAGYLAKHLPKG